MPSHAAAGVPSRCVQPQHEAGYALMVMCVQVILLV
jgi:hypothetical protein